MQPAPLPLRLFSAACFAALVLLHPGTSAAQPEDEFLQHHQRGHELYKLKRYDEAATELEAAYALRQWPRLLHDLGLIYYHQGHADRAIDT